MAYISEAEASSRLAALTLDNPDLSKRLTLDNVKAIINDLSPELSGVSSYVFYSGQILGTKTLEIANNLAAQSSAIGIVDSTDAAKFLATEQVKDALLAIYGDTDLVEQRLYADVDSLWAEVSRRYATAASGSIITLTPNAASDGIWATVELPALLSNQNISSINGISREELLRGALQASSEFPSEGALNEAARQVVDYFSLANLSSGGVQTDEEVFAFAEDFLTRNNVEIPDDFRVNQLASSRFEIDQTIATGDLSDTVRALDAFGFKEAGTLTRAIIARGLSIINGHASNVLLIGATAFLINSAISQNAEAKGIEYADSAAEFGITNVDFLKQAAKEFLRDAGIVLGLNLTGLGAVADIYMLGLTIEGFAELKDLLKLVYPNTYNLLTDPDAMIDAFNGMVAYGQEVLTPNVFNDYARALTTPASEWQDVGADPDRESGFIYKIRFNDLSYVLKYVDILTNQAYQSVFFDVRGNVLLTESIDPDLRHVTLYDEGEPSFTFDINNDQVLSRAIRQADGSSILSLYGYDPSTSFTTVREGSVDAQGNAIGQWKTEVISVDPETGNAVTRTAKSTPAGQIIGPWETKVEWTEEYAQSLIDEALRNSGGAVVGAGIGDLFGSSLGQALGGSNVFARIGASSVLSTVLSDIGRSIGIAAGVDNESLEHAVQISFADFGEQLFAQLKSSSINALSSFLIAELSDELNLDDSIGAGIATTIARDVTGTAIGNIVNSLDGAPLDLFHGLELANIVTSVSSFMGSYLAHEILEPQTTAGAIGGSIGGSLGTAIGLGLAGAEGFLGSLGAGILEAVGLSTAIGMFSGAFAILIPGIGALVGVLLGTVLGDALAPFFEDVWDDWLGNNPPRADAWVDYNPLTGTFIADPTGHQSDGGPRDAAVGIAKVAAELLNVYREAIGGTVLSNGDLRRNFYIWTDQTNMFRGPGGNFRTADQALNAGVLAMLKLTQIAGGDLYVKRAIQHSQATTVEELNGDLQIAQDYARYLEFKDVIDLLIAADPNSAFAAGWIITLIRAQELGITDWSASDFQGGLMGFFDALGLGKLGATPDDVQISVDGTALKLLIVVNGETVRTIRIEDFANKIGYQLVGSATGTPGNDIWTAGNSGSSFTDAATATTNLSNDILLGGAGGDTINAGLGWDFVRGGGGNDQITGGAGNDALYGGDGNDTIYGEDNTGFAPIPTGILSDAAVAGAPLAFDSIRRIWFGGGDPADVSLSHNYTPPAQDFNEDELHGGAGNDQIAGGAGDDVLGGDAGIDTLYGDAGNDILDGGAGADVIHGGAGFDTASYESAETGINVDLGATPNNGTASDGDTLFDIEDLIGSRFGDILIGDAYSNLIDGGIGSDTIDGRGGRDTASFFGSLYGVEIDMGTGTAVTRIPGPTAGQFTTQTDTLLNIEDVLGSTHDDKLTGSAAGGGLDSGAGNDTIILRNDDLDIVGGAGAYTVRGGQGIDTLDFSGWVKPRGVQLDLNGAGGNRFTGIEKVIGTTLQDRFTGTAEAEIFDGGAGNDIFNVSGGRDVYLYDRGDGQDLLAASKTRTGLSGLSKHGSIQVGNQTYYRRVQYSTQIVYGATNVDYKDVVRSSDKPLVETKPADGSLVFGGAISYHDIFGSLAAADTAGLNLIYDTYFYGGASSLSSNQQDMDHTGQILTRAQLLAQLSSLDLILGVKTQDSYAPGTDLSGLSGTIRIQGGGLLPVEATSDSYWVGFSSAFTLQTDVPVGSWSDSDGGSGTYFGDVATHQGTRYEFEANTAIARLGFEGSGHIELAGVKYFKDGSAAADTLTAAPGQGTWIYGGALNDVITGADKGDVLVGGADNDRLQGGAGDDQYAYWLGDGHDIITDLSGADTIVFGGGISSDDVKLKIGKLANPADYTSFRDALAGEVPVDLRIEIYNPETHAVVGSISVVDFQNVSNLNDKLRFAGDYEITLLDFLAKQGQPVRPTLTGTAGNDTLTGGDAGEDFYGLAGNDVMRGNAGDDVFYAHGGSDAIAGGDGSDTIDYKFATGAVNIVLGGDDPDAIEADGSNDDLSSIENAAGSEYGDIISGTNGASILVGRGGNDVINGRDGNDTLSGGEGNDQISGGNHDDLIYGDRGNDVIAGDSGNDTLSYAGFASAITANLQAGTAVASFTANGVTTTETDTISTIENLTGTDFNDTIIGGAVAGTYDGGLGDDRFIILNDDVDVAAGGTTTTLIGGLGTDTLDFSGWSKGRGVSVDLGGSRYNSIEKLIGSAFGDTLRGNSGAQTLIGGAGNDQLIGLGGADVLDGGADIDTADYSASTGGVTVDLAAGTGTGGDAEGDTLTGIESLVGSASADTLRGNAADNYLSGGAGNDTLQGGAGNDGLAGGAGADSLQGGDGGDYADYTASSAAVSVDLQSGLGSGGDAAGDTLSGMEGVAASQFDDTLYGDAGYNNFWGNTGNDIIAGRGGADFLDGYTGNDQYLYNLGDGDDIISDLSGVDKIVFGAGITSGRLAFTLGRLDDIYNPGSFHAAPPSDQRSDLRIQILDAGGAVVGSVTIVDIRNLANAGDLLRFADGSEMALSTLGIRPLLVGTAGDDTLTGGDAGEDFYGLAGNDVMRGNGGDDVFYAHGGSDSLIGGDGTDTIDYRFATGGVDVVIGGNSPRIIEADGSRDAISSIENVVGSEFGDSISGTNGANVLTGLGGNDVINAAGGNDIIYGGDGNDQIDGGANDDLIYGDRGNDTVNGAANIDTLSYSGFASAINANLQAGTVVASFTVNGINTTETDTISNIENLTGTDFNDTIIGGAAAGTYDGGAGDDRFIILNDDVDVAAGATASTLFGGSGTDTLDFSGWAKGRGVSADLVQARYSGIDRIIGSSLGDTLRGTTGNQTLIGGAGNDQLTGLSGADVLDGGADIDTADYSASSGGVTVDLATGIGTGGDAQGDTLTSIESLLGSANADTLRGNAGDNYLSGGGGNDALQGGAGNDGLAGGAGADSLQGGDGGDYADYTASGAAVSVDLQSGLGSGGDAAGDTLSGIEAVAASQFDDTLYGDAGYNNFWGNAGNDIIAGRGGADFLDGYTGNDQYLYNLGDGDDIISDLSGIDKVVFGAGITGDRLVFALGRLDDIYNPGSFHAAPTSDQRSDLRIQILDAGGAVVGSVTIIDIRNTLNGGDLLHFADGSEVALSSLGIRPLFVGTAGNDTLTGGDAGEDFYGLAGNDTMRGNGGDDVFYAHGGADSLIGGDGADTIDYRFATGGVDVIIGGNSPRIIEADGSRDSISSIENVVGSEYGDSISGTNGVNILTGLGGNDTIAGAGGNDIISGGDGDDQIDGGANDDLIYGDRGNDTINGAANIDTLSYVGLAAGITANLQAGTVVASFNVNGVTTTETDAISNIENLTGSNFSDTIIGGAVAGTYDGAGGDDRFIIINDDTDVAAGATAATLFGGGGTDSIDFSGWSKGRGAFIELFNARYNSVEQVIGSALDDTFRGSTGNETFLGGAGNDVLAGLSGADVINGGDGWDIGDYTWSSGGVSVDLAAGTGTGGDAQGDTLTGIEALFGSTHDDVLRGNAGDNYFNAIEGNDLVYGGAGNDWLIGGAGKDTLDGGDGIDVADFSDRPFGVVADLNSGYAVEQPSGQVRYLTLTGYPPGTVFSEGWLASDGTWMMSADAFLRLNITPPAGVSSFELKLTASVLDSAASVIDRSGQVQATVSGGVVTMALKSITARQAFEEGASGWNTATITDGGAGFSRFLRGAGQQSTGLLRDYVLPGFSGPVTVGFDFYEIDSWDNEQFLTLINGVQVSVERFSHALFDNDHVNSVPVSTVLQNLGFSSYNDEIHRYTFSTTITEGAIQLRTRSWLDDTTADESYGIDNITFTMLMTGSGAQNKADLLATILGRSADRLVNIESLSGSAYVDFLTGNASANWISGGAGNDVLTGLGGNDLLQGGAGDDYYVYYPGSGDDIIDDPSGIDKFVFGGLNANNLVLTVGKLADPNNPASFGAAAWGDLQYDLRVQVLASPGGAVTGSVILRDFRNSLNISDVFRFADGSEISVAQLLINRGQGPNWGGTNVLPLFTGTEGNDTITGSAGNDELIGFGGADIINGGDGGDVIYALGGADTINGGAGDDWVSYEWASGPMTINLSTGVAIEPGNVTDTLSSIEHAVGSIYADTITGTSGANTFYSSSGNDIVNAGSGADTVWAGWGDDQIDGGANDDLIHGEQGNDTIIGGTGNDQFFMAPGDGRDVITDTSGTDTLVFDGGINPTDLWFARQGNNLVISRLGSADNATVTNWFASTSSQIEQIKAANGAETLMASEVNTLISQMAAFAAQVGADPSTVQPSSLPPEYQLAVNAVWHLT